MHLQHLPLLAAIAGCIVQPVVAMPHQARAQEGKCEKTKVVILGAGVAGITAAQALTNASVHDFLILEYRDTIGGRAWHKPFGKNKDGNPYTIEMGANWVQGIGSPDGPQNPIWQLAQKSGLVTQWSNYDNVSSYNKDGSADFTALFDAYEEASEIANQQAGKALVQNIQDSTAKTGLAVAGWNPKFNDMEAQAVDWWEWDFEAAYSPQESSFIFGYAGDNTTFNYFSDHDEFVMDQRGFNIIIKDLASTFLEENDPRLHLNTEVTNVTYSDHGVTVHNKDGSCVEADYAITTFSLGVLQHGAVTFHPELPPWKQEAIHKFTMGTYTKIFFQFNETFWPSETQYHLYADPTTRGWYPIWQSLSTPDFLPDSNIIFVTLTNEFSHRAELQSDEQTKQEGLAVLRKMFPEKTIPEPTAFMYPRWTSEPWAHGSYSNWPPSTTLEMHENLRANTGRLWFAGEATSPTFFGFLHGAYFEGLNAGRQIAAIMKHECVNAKSAKLRECGPRKHYETLHGTTFHWEYTQINGWAVDSFVDNNPDEEG
ncbi:Flavin amine oxidase [Penicillium sp. DV-2018c]|nr:Flavin amine oxidase [Penicillium sp. DV-2018c]